MRRTAPLLSISLLISVSGCQWLKPQPDPLQTAEVDYGSLSPDLYVTDAAVTTPYESVPIEQPNYASLAPSRQPVSLTSETVMPTTRTHMVAKGDTLYRLARQYYGNQSRWRDIYDANRQTLSNPNNLRVGQELTLP